MTKYLLLLLLINGFYSSTDAQASPSGMAAAVARGADYDARGLTDSAIYELTPYVFFNPAGNTDSATYTNTCRNYLKILRKRYTTADINEELQHAFATFSYQEINETDATHPDSLIHHIGCTFHFLNYTITYLDTRLKTGKDDTLPFPYSGAYQMEYLERTPIVKMIRKW